MGCLGCSLLPTVGSCAHQTLARPSPRSCAGLVPSDSCLCQLHQPAHPVRPHPLGVWVGASGCCGVWADGGALLLSKNVLPMLACPSLPWPWLDVCRCRAPTRPVGRGCPQTRPPAASPSLLPGSSASPCLPTHAHWDCWCCRLVSGVCCTLCQPAAPTSTPAPSFWWPPLCCVSACLPACPARRTMDLLLLLVYTTVCLRPLLLHHPPVSRAPLSQTPASPHAVTTLAGHVSS